MMEISVKNLKTNPKFFGPQIRRMIGKEKLRTKKPNGTNEIDPLIISLSIKILHLCYLIELKASIARGNQYYNTDWRNLGTQF